MRFLSDDGKVFNTEQECVMHENFEKRNEEKIKKEKLERERKERLDNIKKTYEELQQLISEFYRDYGVKRELHISPACDLIDILLG